MASAIDAEPGGALSRLKDIKGKKIFICTKNPQKVKGGFGLSLAKPEQKEIECQRAKGTVRILSFQRDLQKLHIKTILPNGVHCHVERFTMERSKGRFAAAH